MPVYVPTALQLLKRSPSPAGFFLTAANSGGLIHGPQVPGPMSDVLGRALAGPPHVHPHKDPASTFVQSLWDEQETFKFAQHRHPSAVLEQP